MHRQLLQACHPCSYPRAAEAALLLVEDDESNLLVLRKGNLSNILTFKNGEAKLQKSQLTEGLFLGMSEYLGSISMTLSLVGILLFVRFSSFSISIIFVLSYLYSLCMTLPLVGHQSAKLH